MPKCVDKDLIVNRDQKQSSTLFIMDHPQNQIDIEGLEPNGGDKIFFFDFNIYAKCCKRTGV